MKPEENLLCVKTHYQMDVKKKAFSLLMIMIMTMVTMTIMMIEISKAVRAQNNDLSSERKQ